MIRHTAIRNVYPDVVTIDGNTDAWNSDGEKVVLDDNLINSEINRLQAEYEAKAYQRNRASEYPPITDYLDGVVKGDQAQIDAYIAACQAVKNKYPKPE